MQARDVVLQPKLRRPRDVATKKVDGPQLLRLCLSPTHEEGREPSLTTCGEMIVKELTFAGVVTGAESLVGNQSTAKYPRHAVFVLPTVSGPRAFPY